MQERSSAKPRGESVLSGLLRGVFFLSGFLALVYEICWIRKATLVFGGAVFALSCVLAVFFGGLALGSWWFGRLSVRYQRPVRLYGILELAIGGLAVLSPALFVVLDRVHGMLYDSLADSFVGLTLLRCVLLTVVLAPPTVCMGGTFPLMCRWFVRSNDRISGTVGGLFALNTFGASLGAATCGFYLIPRIGVSASIYLAGGLSVLLGALVLRFAATRENAAAIDRQRGDGPDSAGRHDAGDEDPAAGREATGGIPSRVTIGMGGLFFVSGFVALGNETLWTRFLSLVLLSSVFTYTLVLTVVLLGLVLGAFCVARFFDRSQRRAAWFGVIQMGIGLTVLGTLLAPAEFWLRWMDEEDPLRQCVLVMLILLVPACLSGAAFPLAIRMVVERSEFAGARVGRMTALNTFGGIAGSMLFGFVMLPAFGMQVTAVVSTGASVAAGVAAILLLERSLRVAFRWGIAILGVGVWGFLVQFPRAELPGDYLRVGEALVEYREGVNAVVSITESDLWGRRLKIDRLWQGSNRRGHQVMAAHVPMILHPNAREVVVVGIGAGQTASRFLLHDIGRLDCVEIEGETLAMLRRHFDSEWMDDPRVRFIVDDGRNYLSHTGRDYDVISIEVGQTYRPGVASFYTRDFYTRAAERLKPGGMLCQFMPISFFTMEEFKALAAAFLTVFPHCSLWYNTSELLLLGSRDAPILIPFNALNEALLTPRVQEDLDFSYWGGREQRLNRPEVFLGSHLMNEDGLAALAEGATAYTDERPFLEYSRAEAKNMEREFNQLARPLLAPPGSILASDWGVGRMELIESIRDRNLRNMVAMALKETIREAYLMRDGERVLTELREAVSWNPDNIALQTRLGNLLFGQGRFAEAAAAYRRILETDPTFPQAHYNLGLALKNLGRLAEAAASFRDALKFDPDLADARRELGGLSGSSTSGPEERR